MLIGSGAVILNPVGEDYLTLSQAVQGDNTKGELLGGTSGGVNFSTDVETINLGDDVDGLSVALRGALQFDTEAVSLETNLIELIPGRLKTLNPRLDATQINSDATKATTTRGTTNSAVTVTADEPGTAGNSIRFQILASTGNNVVGSVAVVVGATTDIILTPSTDGAGVITTTSHQAADLINNTSAAGALVTATYGGNGTGLIAASAIAALTGGTAGTTLGGTRYDPRGYFKDADYINKMALLIESRNKLIRVAVILYNCIVTSGFSLETQENASPLQVPFTIQAMADATRKDAATGSYYSPYRVLDFSTNLAG